MSRTSIGAQAAEILTLVATAAPSDIPAVLGPPQPVSAGPGIDITLAQARPRVAEVHIDRRHLPGALTVVVGLRGFDIDTYDVLHDLWAAFDLSDYAFADETPTDQWWAGFGVEPRPCVSLQVPVLVERSVIRAPMVLDDIQVINAVDSPGRQVRARVVGPGDRPVEGAQVTCVQTPSLETKTDHQGYFTLQGYFAGDSVPIEVRHYHLSANVNVPIGATDLVVSLTAPSAN